MQVDSQHQIIQFFSYSILLEEIKKGEDEDISPLHKRFPHILAPARLVREALKSPTQVNFVTRYVGTLENVNYTCEEDLLKKFSDNFVEKMEEKKIEKSIRMEMFSNFVDEVVMLFNNTSSKRVENTCFDIIDEIDTNNYPELKKKKIFMDRDRYWAVLNGDNPFSYAEAVEYIMPEPWNNVKYNNLKPRVN